MSLPYPIPSNGFPFIQDKILNSSGLQGKVHSALLATLMLLNMLSISHITVSVSAVPIVSASVIPLHFSEAAVPTLPSLSHLLLLNSPLKQFSPHNVPHIHCFMGLLPFTTNKSSMASGTALPRDCPRPISSPSHPSKTATSPHSPGTTPAHVHSSCSQPAKAARCVLHRRCSHTRPLFKTRKGSCFA